MSAPRGMLGGTFDPVHDAHLAMARAALEHLHLARILWVPTGNPDYRKPARASPRHRLAMLELALAGEPRYEIDTRELAPGASPYTVDTLRRMRAEPGGGGEIVLLLGSDQYAKLESWHEPQEVRRLARIAVFERPGAPVRDAGVQIVPFEPMPVSASDIRARAARGEDLSGLVPAPVANYIARHRLYR